MPTLETVNGSSSEFQSVFVTDDGKYLAYKDGKDIPAGVYPESSVLSVEPEEGVERVTEELAEKVGRNPQEIKYATDILVAYKIT